MIDVAQQAVGVSFADNVWARRVVNIQNDLLRQYVQWQFQWADTTGGGCEDCEVRSNYIISGFEAFKATRRQVHPAERHQRAHGDERLGRLADRRRRPAIHANSLHPESDRNAASPHHAIINVNTNTESRRKSRWAASSVTANYAVGLRERAQRLASGHHRQRRQPEHPHRERDLPCARLQEADRFQWRSGPELHRTEHNRRWHGRRGTPEPGRANIFIQRGRGENCSAQVVEASGDPPAVK